MRENCVPLLQTWMSALNKTVDVHRTVLTTSVITRVHVSADTQMCTTTAHYVQVNRNTYLQTIHTRMFTNSFRPLLPSMHPFLHFVYLHIPRSGTASWLLCCYGSLGEEPHDKLFYCISSRKLRFPSLQIRPNFMFYLLDGVLSFKFQQGC